MWSGKPASVESDICNTYDSHCYGQYIIGEWNLNGFKSLTNPYNELFKRHVLSSVYFDIIILAESHCLPNDSIELDNFKVYHNNRPLNNNARRGSGGIAIAINNSVLDTHIVVSVTKGVDGQLAIKLKNINSGFLLGILALYLPPDSYMYGRDPESFFNQASVLWEGLFDCDLLIGGGRRKLSN